MKSYCYDIEVTRNYLSVAAINLREYLEVFKDVVDKDKPVPLTDILSVADIEARLASITKHSFVIHNDNADELHKLLSFLNQEDTDLFGYNSAKYDKLMLSAIRMYWNRFNTTKEFLKFMYETSQRIIRTSNNDLLWQDNFTSTLLRNRSSYRDIDLMKIFRLDFFKKSLKQVSINLKWYNLLEFKMPPIAEDIDAHYYRDNIDSCRGMSIEYLNSLYSEVWDRFVPDEYLDIMSTYNFNDVFICCELIRLNQEEIKLRYSISDEYKVFVYSDSRSVIADKIITKLYSKATNLRPEEFRDKKTIRKQIIFKDIILDKIKYNTPELQMFLDEVKQVVIQGEKGEFAKKLHFRGSEYSFATGGLHTDEIPEMFKSDATRTIRDCDVASFYPSIVRVYRIHPAHMNVNVWVKLITGIINERLDAKRAKRKTKAECLKIVINSGVFGKMGSEDSFLCDRKAMYSVTINGQLMLLMLIEKLEEAGIHVISANTDGIISSIPTECEEAYFNICKWWEEYLSLELEYTDYDVYFREGVNSYGTKKPDGSCKFKGRMNPKMFSEDLSKGYNCPIIAKAVTNYFIYNTPVMETITNAKNILDFCRTQNIARKYCLEYITVKDGMIHRDKIQRNTRFYVSNTGGTLFKIEESLFEEAATKKVPKSALTAGENVRVCNLVEDKPLDSYDINYMYYYNEAMSMINPIKLERSNKKKGKNKNKKTFGMYNRLFE